MFNERSEPHDYSSLVYRHQKAVAKNWEIMNVI